MIRVLSAKKMQSVAYVSRQKICDRLLSTAADRPTVFERAWMGFKHLIGKIPPTKRERVELQELRLALLSIHSRRYEEDNPNQSHENKLSKLWKENERLKNVGLRYEIQVELVPELLELFETYHLVDKQLESSPKQIDMLLFQDYEETCRAQHHSSSNNDYFLSTKRGALEILLRDFGRSDSIPPKALPWESSSSGGKHWYDQLDEFGYNGKNAKLDVYKAIRYHQAYNMARSFLIKQHLGYSVLALKSNLAQAGRGMFLDGTAPSGAILAFFPGQVWPREYLISPTHEVIEYLSWKNNPNFQLHFRGDDYCFDCRASPYTVLKESNPWAIAHIANHAPWCQANSRSIGINFFEKMRLNSSLRKYIPNEYAKPPTLMGGSILDRDAIEMHSFCLINRRREISYEEILFDYNLSFLPEEMPEWYLQAGYKSNGMHEVYS
mmetsp:Transcript_10646/g.15666  ORF Transcript_10646/g.15666 Transcript_10646/m.15666 type:complete len:438 (-) Transcript_10646:287-1600(-)